MTTHRARTRVLATLISTIVASAVAAAWAGSAPAAAQPCADVEVVFARGTFEPPGVGSVGRAFVDALTARASTRSIGVQAVDYPASLDFGAAVRGVVDAGDRLQRLAAECPRTRLVLGGYSQGAAVAAYVTEDAVPEGYPLPPDLTGPLPAEVADRVAAVVLFGKPSPRFMQAIFSGAPPIEVGPRYVGRTIDLCTDGDPVCSSEGGDNGAHSRYVDAGLTDRAADVVVQRLRS